ncbi:MAG: sulfatase [Marinifilaceae bacterium]
MTNLKNITTLGAFTLLPMALSAAEKPNIIFFLVDDMGWQDTSVPFWSETTPQSKQFHTPNMERLAQQGVKFTNAYACPVSSPSRISLMTGSNASQHKVTNWTLHQDKSTDQPHKTLNFERWNYNGMSPERTDSNAFYSKALPQILRENGYTTAIVGKAHLGAINTPAADPTNIGFDVNIGGHAAGAMGSYLGEYNYGNKQQGTWTAPWGVPHLETYHGSNTFLTEALTLESCKFMQNCADAQKPFFLYLSHYAVHAPFTADKRFYDKYIKAGLTPKEAEYASLVEGMDKSLGDIMDWLETNNQAKNTIIIFMSDNGGYSVGRGGEAAQRNYPLRGGKGACYEGGIREPLIVSWPGVATPGSENQTPVIIEDCFASILDMANVRAYLVPQQVDGISFAKAIRKNKTINPQRPLVFHYPNNWGERHEDVGIPQSAIRIGKYKMVHTYETGKNEIYDLSDDIGERNNLIHSPHYAKIAEKMARVLSRTLRINGSNMPVNKADNTRLPYPDEV